MSKRLRVLMDESELREIQRVARRNRMTVAEWARQALREARIRESVRNVERKLDAVRILTFDADFDDVPGVSRLHD